MNRRSILLVLMLAFLVASCSRTSELPDGAKITAFIHCPISECEKRWVGPSTKRLSTEGTEYEDRWCVEVVALRDGVEQRYAVRVTLVDPSAPPGLGDWAPSRAYHGEDCSIFEQ